VVTLALGDPLETVAHAGAVEALGGFGLRRSLQRLFIDHGTTPEAVAALLPFPVDPALFYRVDAQRQPLPADVAEAIARVLTTDFAGRPTRVDVGTVNGMARLVTRERGEHVRRPLPPDPLANPNPFFGEHYQPPELSPYRVPRPLGGSIQLWSFGTSGGVAAFAEVDRGGNVVADLLAGGIAYGFVGNGPSAYDGRLVWTAGPNLFGPAGQFWIQCLSTSPAAVASSNNAATVGASVSSAVSPFAIAFEPESARLWLTDLSNGYAFRIDPVALVSDQAVALTLGGHSYGGAGLVAVGGKLYAVGTYNLGSPGEDGRLFEIDPFLGAVTRVSTGANLGAALGLDYDPASRTFFVAGAAGNTFPSGGSVSAVPRDSFVGANLSVTVPAGAPSASQGFIFATVAYGSLWLSSQASTLWCAGFDGTIRRWFQPNPSSSFLGQQAASDGQGFLWFPDGNATLYLLSPGDHGPAMAAASSVAAVAGSALVLREGVPPPLVA
jgi:hypothetical protein